MAYNWLVNIKNLNFENKSVLLIGANWMAEQYAAALAALKVNNVTVLAKTDQHVNKLCEKFKFRPLTGGFEKHLPGMEKKDLVIVATQIPLLISVTELALKSGQDNILVEKPGSLYKEELQKLAKIVKNQSVRIAYNRLMYPNVEKLKELVAAEGGITSCTYMFTEWIHTFDITKFAPDVLKRWGIANSLHVISTAHDLVGLPKELAAYQKGSIEWHPSGDCFVGSGISEKGIPFSYHANWKSAGRWGIDVMTEKNAYRLMPMEDLQVCKKGTVNWEKVAFESPFQGTKQGVAEQVAVMLDKNSARLSKLVNLEKAIAFNKLAEKIFGYQ